MQFALWKYRNCDLKYLSDTYSSVGRDIHICVHICQSCLRYFFLSAKTSALNMRCRDTFAPAALLFYLSTFVVFCGALLIIVGYLLIQQEDGLGAHLSISYVGIVIFVSGFPTLFLALYRICLTRRRLKQLGLTLRQFTSQWSDENLLKTIREGCENE